VRSCELEGTFRFLSSAYQNDCEAEEFEQGGVWGFFGRARGRMSVLLSGGKMRIGKIRDYGKR